MLVVGYLGLCGLGFVLVLWCVDFLWLSVLGVGVSCSSWSVVCLWRVWGALLWMLWWYCLSFDSVLLQCNVCVLGAAWWCCGLRCCGVGCGLSMLCYFGVALVGLGLGWCCGLGWFWVVLIVLGVGCDCVRDCLLVWFCVCGFSCFGCFI